MDDPAIPALLETPRLVLRPWRAGEAPIQRRLWEERDPRVPAARRIDAQGRPTLADLEAWIARGPQPPAPGLLAIERRAEGDVIGYCGLIRGGHAPADAPELAYELLRSAQGHGYATEAGRAVVAVAREAGHPRLWASVRVWNTASRRVLEKLGFTEQGIIARDAVHGDNLLTGLAL